LRKFKEKPLIDNVILPLFEKMEFKNIILTYGTLGSAFEALVKISRQLGKKF
jgi:hypothetical protein